MADLSNSNLLNTATGILKKNACIVLVKTEWNAAITDELENGCLRYFKTEKVKSLETLIVPGAIEIPFAIKKHWENANEKHKPDAYIALGCVIRGGTPHFEYVCRSVTDGITQLNLLLPVPTIFGVLTVDNEEQARERLGGKHGHKGEEAAITALKMIAFSRNLNK
ncbi:MAG: 6,7-dimethyl-8-ribityllumazine synthase [Sphingobacteriales bacterium 12-47-4]|nr:MAG: 6,7-dimethyl-8-ribityllumazine synthase [Sphingobacteriales bacterium 12-47-4]